MTEIYLDAYHLHSLTVDLPTRVRQPLSGIESAAIRLDSYNRPGEHGTTIANALYGEQTIALEGSLHGRGATEAAAQSDYRRQRQLLREAVSIKRDANGTVQPRVLALIDLTGAVWRLNVVTRRFVLPETLPTYSTWMLELAAVGFIESATQTSLTLTLPKSGGVTIPATFPLVFGASSGGSLIATNAGTAETYPTITLQGPLINPSITNETTGERLALTLTLGASDTVVINMARRTILQGGTTNRMGAKSAGSTFWSLSPGDNTLRFRADAYDVGTATVAYRSAYLGL